MKSLQEYLVTGKDSDEIIWKFAFLGRQETLNSKLQELSELAETENWTSSNSTNEATSYTSSVLKTKTAILKDSGFLKLKTSLLFIF